MVRISYNLHFHRYTFIIDQIHGTKTNLASSSPTIHELHQILHRTVARILIWLNLVFVEIKHPFNVFWEERTSETDVYKFSTSCITLRISDRNGWKSKWACPMKSYNQSINTECSAWSEYTNNEKNILSGPGGWFLFFNNVILTVCKMDDLSLKSGENTNLVSHCV